MDEYFKQNKMSVTIFCIFTGLTVKCPHFKAKTNSHDKYKILIQHSIRMLIDWSIYSAFKVDF